jgi:hypothetical protein
MIKMKLTAHISKFLLVVIAVASVNASKAQYAYDYKEVLINSMQAEIISQLQITTKNYYNKNLPAVQLLNRILYKGKVQKQQSHL